MPRVSYCFWVIALLSLLLVVTPVILVFLILLATWRFLVGVVLKIKHGTRFVEVLSILDSRFIATDLTDLKIPILLVVKSDKDFRSFAENIKRFIDERVSKIIKSYYKLNCSLEKFLGVYYLLRSDFDIDNYVRIVRIKAEDRRELQDKFKLCEIVCKYAKIKYWPRNKYMGKVLLFDEALEDNKYIVLFTYNHAAADGMSALQFLLQSMLDNEKHLAQNVKARANFKLESNLVFNAIKNIPRFISEKKEEPPFLNLDPNKKLITFVEDQRKTVPAIKNIKRILPEIRFSHVILAGFSAAFSKYFEDSFSRVPKCFRVNLPVPLKDLSGVENVDLSNKLSFLSMDLPIGSSDKSCYERLREIAGVTEKIQPSEILFHYWMVKFFSAIPRIFLPKFFHGETVMSNIPGPEDKITSFNGNLIEDVFFWSQSSLDLQISTLTYDHRFQINLNISESLISGDGEALREIGKNFFKYVQDLQEEVMHLP